MGKQEKPLTFKQEKFCKYSLILKVMLVKHIGCLMMRQR